MVKRGLFGVVLLALLSVTATAQEVYDPGYGVTLPTVVKEIHLIGTTDATVGIECVVSPDGRVGTATVVVSPDAKLNNAAIRALKQWRFKPGTKDGRPVSVRIFVEITVEHT